MELGWRAKLLERAAYLQGGQVCSELVCVYTRLTQSRTLWEELQQLQASPVPSSPARPATPVPSMGYCHYLVDASSLNYRIRDDGTLHLMILHISKTLQVTELYLSIQYRLNSITLKAQCSWERHEYFCFSLHSKAKRTHTWFAKLGWPNNVKRNSPFVESSVVTLALVCRSQSSGISESRIGYG